MLGVFIPLPDIQAGIDPATSQPVIQPKIGADGQPVLLMHVTMEEAQKLADDAYAVAIHYDLAKYFSGKTPALAALILTAGTIYVPKFMTAKMVVAAMKAQRPPPANAADMMHSPETPETRAPGVYKYQ